jgi:two-component system, cell cycle sensor histidine kinase and response regulator CckA
MASARLRAFVTLVGLLAMGPALAQSTEMRALLTPEESSWLAEHPVLKLGVDPAWPPVEFVDADGKYSGMAADMVRLLAGRIGVEMRAEPGLSWSGVLERARQHKLDLVPALTPTPDRAEYLDFSDPHIDLPVVLICRVDDHAYESLYELRRHRVLVVRDYPTEEWLRRDYPTVEVVTRPSAQAALSALEFGEADAYVGDLASASYAIKDAGLAHLRVTAETPYRYRLVMGVPKGNPVLVSILNKAISTLTKGDRDRLYADWVSLRQQGVELRRVLAFAIPSLVLCILIVLVGANWRLRHEVRSRREAEAATAEREQRFRALFQHAPDPAYIIDRAGLIADANDPACRELGRDRGHLVGSRMDAIDARFGEPGTVEGLWDSADPGASVTYESLHRRSDGVPIPVEVRLTRMALGSEDCLLAFARSLAERERAEAERHLLETQLQRTQRLESLGVLAGGIAHDFNNVLAAISGFTELALQELPAEALARTYLEETVTAATRARDLVRQVLALSRQVEPARRLIHVESVVEETMRFLRASLPATIEIDSSAEQGAGDVVGDATQLQQVLMNLCTNAAHSMRERGGRLTVDVARSEVDAALAVELGGVPTGPYVRFTVSDTGCGMDDATRESIFDPFFTTKAPGEGTGLGLSVVHSIVSAHGGAITVASVPDIGSTFRVYLPAADEGSERGADLEAEAPMGGTERILVVDDEPALASMAAAMLGALGYTATRAEGGAEALSLFLEEPDQFDIVVTDQAMPGLTGVDLAGEIRKARPEVPVLFVTGYGHRVGRDRPEDVPNAAVLPKPYALGELARAVRALLDGPG